VIVSSGHRESAAVSELGAGVVEKRAVRSRYPGTVVVGGYAT
jgi:hypothetical protein